MLCEPCPACGGTGMVKTTATVVAEILRQLQRDLTSAAHFDVQVLAHPRVVAALRDDEKPSLKHLELRFNKRIRLVPSTGLSSDHYEITSQAQSGAQAARLPAPPPEAAAEAEPQA
jgi:ribonuclease G